MNDERKPCARCSQPVCDYRRCAPYRTWIKEAWKRFQRYTRHDYWIPKPASSTKFAYQHPNLTRRYLQEGPCALCSCAHICDAPCMAYWYWWDARMAWLRWRLQRAAT